MFKNLYSWVVTHVTSIVANLSTDLKQLFASFTRNIFLLLLIFGVVYFGHVSNMEAYKSTINYIISIELLAIFMSNIALFFFTTLNFTKLSQNKENSIGVRAVGFIFLAVHLCVGLSVVGIHFTNFQ
jgi:hypothetical protein